MSGTVQGHGGGGSAPAEPVPERTCRTCACVFLIEKPALMPASMRAQEWDAIPKEQWVCRLNPPLTIQTQRGNALMQMPTNPDSVCWHYKKPGTLAGD